MRRKRQIAAWRTVALATWSRESLLLLRPLPRLEPRTPVLEGTLEDRSEESATPACARQQPTALWAQLSPTQRPDDEVDQPPREESEHFVLEAEAEGAEPATEAEQLKASIEADRAQAKQLRNEMKTLEQLIFHALTSEEGMRLLDEAELLLAQLGRAWCHVLRRALPFDPGDLVEKMVAARVCSSAALSSLQCEEKQEKIVLELLGALQRGAGVVPSGELAEAADRAHLSSESGVT